VSSKRRSRRTIVVDGVTYTWKYGNWIEIRRGRVLVFRRPITDVLNITWDALERADRKGYSYPLTPKRIAELIKEVA